VLELGRSGTQGAAKGTMPVLSDGAVVATLHASNWKEAATAEIGSRSWVFSKRGRELTGRWAAEPADAVRLRARETSWWKGTHRYTTGGRQLAESGTTGSSSPRPTLSAAADLSLDTQVFLLWLELVLGRRSAAAAAA